MGEESALQAAQPESMDSGDATQQEQGAKRVSPDHQPGRKHRMSMTSRLYGNVLMDEHEKGTWVLGLLFFKQDIGREGVEMVVRERLLHIPRFRSRMTGRSFEELPAEELDMDYHVVVVDEPMTRTDVQNQYVGRVYDNFQFDPTKPLWRFTYFRDVDGRSLLLTCIAHCIGDGVSQIEVLFRMLDPETDSDDAKDDAKDASGDALEPTSAMAPAQTQSLRAPPKRKPKGTFGPLNRMRIAAGGVFGALGTVFGAPDTKTSLMREDLLTPSLVKNTAFGEEVSLERVKEVKNKFPGATVTDVLIAVLTMTLRAYLASTGTDDAALSGGGRLRASFPISMRPRGSDGFRDNSPHNKLALGTLRFPLDYKSRTQLVWDVRRMIDKNKLSPAPFIQRRIGQVLLRTLPRSFTKKTFLKVLNGSTAMLSSVPGPQKPVYLAGAEVDELSFLARGTMSLYFGIATYNGNVTCGVCLDSSLGDPADIAKHWKEEFDALYDEVMAHEGPVPRKFKFSRAFDRL